MVIEMAQKKMNFEQSLQRLDEIVKSLEGGEAPLDESLSLFDEGIKLIKSCGKTLDEAEQRVVKLVKGAGGEPNEEAFDGTE